MRINRRDGQEEQEEPRHPSVHLTLRGLPLLPVEVLGGTGLLVPRGSPLVQYLKMLPLLLFFLLLGESRAGAVAGSPASVSGGARLGAAAEAAALAVEGVVAAETQPQGAPRVYILVS